MNSKEIFDYLSSNKNINDSEINDLILKSQKQIEESNDDLAMNNLGFIYKYSKKDYVQAEKWYLKGSNLGNSFAMSNLGALYEDLQDYVKAEEWYLKGSNLGNPYAMNNLGSLYELVKKDNNKAEEWYHKGSLLGIPVAMCNLGTLCYKIKKDRVKAEEWYLKSAYLGNPYAMNNLGYIYEHIDKDYVKAEEWYHKGSLLGIPVAMCNLGTLCYKIKKDHVMAKEWYLKSSLLGDTKATKNLLQMINDNLINDPEITLEKLKDLVENMSEENKQDYEKTIIKYKKLTKIFNDINTDSCCFCYSNLLGTCNRIDILICGHVFHRSCIKGQTICPYCKHEINE